MAKNQGALLTMRCDKWRKEIELPNLDKIRTPCQKGNFQILGNIGIGHHRRSGDERKKELKRVSHENEKSMCDQTVQQESHQKDENLGYGPENNINYKDFDRLHV